MIQKIEKITSVGKFRDFTAKGNISFNYFTLLYADNGAGKTTLASILRSLMNGDKNLIHKRLSTNSKADQMVQIFEKDSTGAKKTYSFGKSGWGKTLDNIEIFDIFFVNENIYSGLDISDEHKKNLHHFIVGAEGVEIKNKIIKNKHGREQLKIELEKITEQIILKVGYNLIEDEVKDFIRIKSTEALNIDAKIRRAQIELKNALAQKTISRYPELPLLEKWTTSIDFINLIKDIQSTTKTIQDKALEKMFAEHTVELAENTVENPEDWLRIGFDYVAHKIELSKNKILEEVDCPFCKQELSSKLEIINAYTQVFNDEFNNYLEKLNKHLSKVSKFNLEVLLNSKNSAKKTFVERIEFWQEYIKTNIPAFKLVSSSNAEKLKDSFSILKNAVETKAKNPSKAGSGIAVRNFQFLFNQVNTNIDVLNKEINLYNASIRTFKRELKDPLIVENELQLLQRTKQRFEKDVIDLCNDYIRIFKVNKQLEDKYTQLSRDEEAASNKFISTYAKQINYYLQDVFDTPFQIKNMQHGIRKGKGKDAKVEYELLLDRNPISFHTEDDFCVRECLSEGDKSTIAFSFFLSKLEIDPKLSDKILVFDDPLSSLDSNRRHTTVKLILEISKKIHQTIVLSHNENFLWELYKDYDSGLRKALRISQNHLTDNSFIENLNIEYLVENEYFVHINEMEQWLKNPDIKEKERVLGLIRNVLESHIKFKFYRQLKHINPNKQTFGTCINELEKSGVPFRDDTDRISILALLKLLNGISCKPHHGETLPNYKMLGIDPKKITDTELASYVKKTFKLIDEKL